MENENTLDENFELGGRIIEWLRSTPDLNDLHKMFISIAMVSTTENQGEVDEKVFKAVAEWAQMLCQNIELVKLFQAGHLIARAGEDGSLEVDFSKEAAEIIERTKQSAQKQDDSRA